MKGLILKDLYVLSGNLKIYALLYMIYGYMAISQGQTGLMYVMVFITAAMFPVTSISYDERSRWDRLVNTMPVTRKQVVLSKYLLAVILLLVSELISLVVLIQIKDIDKVEMAVSMLVIGLMTLFYQSIIIPVIIKFGSEKGRAIVMAAMGAPVLIMVLLSKSGLDTRSFIVNYGKYIPYFIAALVAVLYALSIVLSIKLYSKKDL